jgi:hypothetical protein
MGQRVSRCHGLKPVWSRLLPLFFLLAWATVLFAACGGDDSGYFTPPPATIIRAAEETTPVSSAPEAPKQESQPAGTLPPPVSGVPSAEGTSYPLPVPTPEESPTPWVYPTP